jgi:hypothetical protein
MIPAFYELLAGLHRFSFSSSQLFLWGVRARPPLLFLLSFLMIMKLCTTFFFFFCYQGLACEIWTGDLLVNGHYQVYFIIIC